jgi:hypothetical protein
MESLETTASGANGVKAGDFGLHVTCDVCGQVVTPENAVNIELTAGGATCPTALSLHQACYESASVMWQPEDPDSTCNYDPLFPETGQYSRRPQGAEG